MSTRQLGQAWILVKPIDYEEEGLGGLLVVDGDGRLVGIMSER